MKKKIIAISCTLAVLLNAANVFAYKYSPPYEAVSNERLEENMPTVFSVDTVENTLAASCDFNSADSSGELVKSYGFNYWSASEGAYVIGKSQTDTASSFALKYTAENGFTEGEIYAFSCKIKTDDVSGSAPKNILAAYSTQWLAAAQSYGGLGDKTGDNDWYEMTQVLEIPKGTTYLNLQGYLPQDMTGTVYFDDFKLYKIGLDPLESVLRSPVYKGLIYGDGYSDIDLDVVVSAREGFYSLENMRLEVSLVDYYDTVVYKSTADTVKEKMNFVFSSHGLDYGDYYLQVVLTDKSTDEIISKKEHTIRKRDESFRPSAYVDENGHYIKNGNKTFINRIYNHSGVGGNKYLTVAQEALEMGVDTVSNYGMWWAVEDEDTGFEFMRQNSLTSHICLSSYWFSDRSNNGGKGFIKNQSDILPFLTEIASDYESDRVLEGYYIFDEPDPKLVGEEIRWNNEILAEADINHPTFGVADKEYDEYGIYTKMTDILGIDPYPITGKTDENGISTDNIAKVGKSVRQIKQNFPNRPVYFVMQGFHYSSRGDLRSPTYAELRNMAWQAICEGAEGLDWYAYPEMTTDTTKTLDEWKEEIETLLTEVKSYKDVIMSDEPAPLYTTIGGGDWLNLSVKRYNGKTYLFAVNNTHTAKSATVNINGIDSIELSFEPLGVVIQEIMQAEFLSPEAEIKNIGFSNGTEIFETAEDGQERILYVPEDSGVINYTARISDGAQLVIGGKVVPLTGKITVRNTDSFTVKVVAQDGVTATYKRYRIVKQ